MHVIIDYYILYDYIIQLYIILDNIELHTFHMLGSIQMPANQKWIYSVKVSGQ